MPQAYVATGSLVVRGAGKVDGVLVHEVTGDAASANPGILATAAWQRIKA